MALILVLMLAFVDITTVKSEPDLEKRSELALANADRAIDEARQAYTSGDDKMEQAALNEVEQSVAISYEALGHTNKAPRKSKYYKNAELKVRALIRRLTSFREQAGFETRQSIDAVISKLSDVHDQLVNDVMSKKK
jgi:phage tail tape-measure protein